MSARIASRITRRRATRTQRQALRSLPVIRTIKAVVVGPANTGKTTTLETLLCGTTTSVYRATLGVEVHPHRVYITQNADMEMSGCSQVLFNVWDCAGDPRYMGIQEGHYKDADVVIVVANTQEETLEWVTKVLAVSDTIPFVLARAKPDLNEDDWRIPFGRGHLSEVFDECMRVLNV